MKTIQSLLALIQLFALGAIVFGFIFVSYPYSSGASHILYRIKDDETRRVVDEWHQDTVELAKKFTIGWGAAVFVLATGATILLASKGYRRNADAQSMRK